MVAVAAHAAVLAALAALVLAVPGAPLTVAAAGQVVGLAKAAIVEMRAARRETETAVARVTATAEGMGAC